MKLYTEEQVKSMINRAKIFDGDVKDNFVYILSDADILLAETPIELPSDEEIKKEAKDNCEYNQFSLRQFDSRFIDTFIDGAKWIKEQILNQNK